MKLPTEEDPKGASDPARCPIGKEIGVRWADMEVSRLDWYLNKCEVLYHFPEHRKKLLGVVIDKTTPLTRHGPGQGKKRYDCGDWDVYGSDQTYADAIGANPWGSD